jgi:putative PEP-CTERM system histidine kinase
VTLGDVSVTLGFPFLAVTGASLLLLAYVLASAAASILRLQVLSVALAGLVWSLWFGLAPAGFGQIGMLGSFLAELILLLAWFGLLERLLRGPYLQSMPELVRRGVRWTWLAVLAAISAALLAEGALELALPLGRVLEMGLLVLALLGLTLSGQLYGDATIEPHAALRSICLAAVGAIGLQCFAYALSVLYTGSPEWLYVLRSTGLIVASALLVFSLHNNPQWSLAIFVSPQASAYAPRLLGSATALLLVLTGIPLFRSMSPPTAAWAAPLYLAVIGLALLSLLYSEPLRAQLRVFVSKHFLPFRYDYREEWLRLIDTLASPVQDRPLPERAIQALAQIIGSPAGVLWMRAAEGGAYQCIETWNTKLKPDDSVSPGDPVVVFMRERQWILDTSELARQPELYPGLTKPEWLESLPDGLLIVPLISSEAVLGFVILFQSSSAFRLTFEEIDLLRTSGRQVAAHLAQYYADRQLSEARQFEAFNRLTAFVMHDLKNLIAQQSLMVKNAAKHKGNPAFFEDAMATIDNSVARMNKLLQQLQTGDASGPARQISLTACVQEALDKCEGRLPVPLFDADDKSVQAFIDGDRLTTILALLVRNAQDATEDTGSVIIGMKMTGASACLTIRDNGCGMEEEFVRHRLFRPFDTTKGSQGMGVGAYQARAFVVASGGMMQVESEPGVGTTISIQLPASEPGSAQSL